MFFFMMYITYMIDEESTGDLKNMRRRVNAAPMYTGTELVRFGIFRASGAAPKGAEPW